VASVGIDPELLLSQYRSGVPEQQLLMMPAGCHLQSLRRMYELSDSLNQSN
jgi:hypothetical protein